VERFLAIGEDPEKFKAFVRFSEVSLFTAAGGIKNSGGTV
jgi:hypothetical protein